MNAVRKPQDRSEVCVTDPDELAAWALYFRVSAKALIQAVEAVGKEPDAVAAYLGV